MKQMPAHDASDVPAVLDAVSTTSSHWVGSINCNLAPIDFIVAFNVSGESVADE